MVIIMIIIVMITNIIIFLMIDHHDNLGVAHHTAQRKRTRGYGLHDNHCDYDSDHDHVNYECETDEDLRCNLFLDEGFPNI